MPCAVPCRVTGMDELTIGMTRYVLAIWFQLSRSIVVEVLEKKGVCGIASVSDHILWVGNVILPGIFAEAWIGFELVWG